MNINFENFYLQIFFLLLFSAAAVLLKPRNKWFFPRLFVYALLFMLILKPDVTFYKKNTKLPVVDIFIDESKSMSVENKRKNALKAAEKFKSHFDGKAKVRLFAFAKDVREVRSIEEITAEKSSTDISSVFDIMEGDARIIITDGRHNAGASPVSGIGINRIPVFTVGIGGEGVTPDLEIADLKAPGFGFRNQKIKVSFNILNPSQSSAETTVYITRDRLAVAGKKVSLKGMKSVPVEIEIEPSEVGLKNYRLKVGEISGEINIANNVRNFHIQVNRQKIRILYVAGQPSWEYSFFRRLVKSDPQAELVSFLILRNPGNVTIVPENELSLIHFPAREMFTSKIYEFDLLIYDNFSYERFFPKSYLTHIKNFVLKGGGFIMMGGEDSFGRGGYADTPLSEILPVKMKRDSEWLNDKFKAELEGNLNHPLLNIADEPSVSKEVWAEMPHLEGYDPSLELQPDSTVLLKKGDVPVLSVRNAGKGRAMAMNFNTTWRWCMGLAWQGKSPYYFNRFWQKVIRFMIQSGNLSNVQVFPGKDRVNAGEKININIKVYDRYWQPMNDASVRLELKLPSGKTVTIGKVNSSGSDGWYNSSIKVTGPGKYTIKAFAYSNGVFIGEDEKIFTGISVDSEMAEISVNKRLLEDMAQLSGAIYWDYSNIEPEKVLGVIGKNRAVSGNTVKLSWHNWIFYVLLTAVILTEWYLRKKRGLL